MSATLVADIETMFRPFPTPLQLKCAKPLEIAAAMLSRAAEHQMTATTVVGVLGYDDFDAFRSLVAALSEEYGLEARVKIQVGSYSVRFSHSSIHALP